MGAPWYSARGSRHLAASPHFAVGSRCVFSSWLRCVLLARLRVAASLRRVPGGCLLQPDVPRPFGGGERTSRSSWLRSMRRKVQLLCR